MMASLEKLIRTLEQLQILENSNLDNHVKKKELLRIHLQNIVESNNSPNVQNHKDFVSYIGSSIDSLIRLCDSKDSDIRLASDEGLYKVIKVQYLDNFVSVVWFLLLFCFLLVSLCVNFSLLLCSSIYFFSKNRYCYCFIIGSSSIAQ